MADCQPPENPKRSPVITQAKMTMAPATKAHAEERLVEIRWAMPDGYALRAAAPLAPPLLAIVITMATSKQTLCHEFTSQHGENPAPDGYERSTVRGRAPVNLPFSYTGTPLAIVISWISLFDRDDSRKARPRLSTGSSRRLLHLWPLRLASRNSSATTSSCTPSIA
jgi:hypothetical protein